MNARVSKLDLLKTTAACIIASAVVGYLTSSLLLLSIVGFLRLY